MNHMPEVAKMLGVKMGEEFEIGEYLYIYRLALNGLEYRRKREKEWRMDSMLFTQLIMGIYPIVKLPLKPKEGEKHK